MKLIVADSSPLIMLAASGLLPALESLAGEVVVPETVFAECTARPEKLGAPEILRARDEKLITLRADIADGGFPDELTGLDAGERAAIVMAHRLGSPVLMDERLGRQAARQHGTTVIGSIGVLLEAKRRGAIPAIGPHLRAWREWGYFISESLLKAALEKAGEE